jgi:branched-subunit amino acid aminotransferase/4-amino-4-deoxychorismate lyase
VSEVVHPGRDHAPGAKRLRPALAEARRALAGAGADADEALLFDAAGRLVEGTRSCLVVVDDAGAAWTPAAALGGVASVALEAARAAGASLREAELSRASLARARELVALNAVRGARPVLALGEAPVGEGTPGPVAAHLARLLAESP